MIREWVSGHLPEILFGCAAVLAIVASLLHG